MSNSNIFRWQRTTQPRVYSRSQRITSGGDVQDWIKTVEEASSHAAAAAFGTGSTPSIRHVISTRIADVRSHEAAYSEAQDLLQQWASEKLDFSSDVLDTACTESAGTLPLSGLSDTQWDTADDIDDCFIYGSHSSNNKQRPLKPRVEKDPFRLLNVDEDDVVQSIIEGMLHTDLIKDDFMQDLGFDDTKKRSDPHTKMNVRHQQVKENKERRLKEKQDHLREIQAKKEAELQARQKVMKEEKLKEMRSRKEEEEIQREMARLRKELEEERRRKANEALRKKQELEKLANLKLEESKPEVEVQVKPSCQVQTDEKRRKILAKIQEIQQREVKENLKLKRRCFSAWYSVVIERRIQLGKAKAMADWKVLFRMFAAWRSLCTEKRYEKEANRHEHLVKQMQRNDLRAAEHHRRHLLTRSLNVWREFVAAEQRNRELTRTECERKNKMAAFLDAAATGRLWSNRGNETANQNGVKNESGGDESNLQSTRSVHSNKSMSSGTPQPSDRRRMSAGRVDAKMSSGVSVPKEAWQVTRQHLHLTKQQISDMGNESSRVPHPNETAVNGSEYATDRRPQSARQPANSARVKGGPPVNTFEHRHRVQQQLLEQQQEQLRQQRQLIEEMQALQRQQLLQQQLANIQRHGIQEPGSDRSNFKPVHLEAHIANVQKELLEVHVNGVRDAVIQNESQLNTDRSSATTVEPNTSRSDNSQTSKAASNTKHLKFLEAMQQRAAERERLRKEREEKKFKLEEEKLMRLHQEAEERRQQEEEAKKEKARLLREKKEMERKKELEKQKEMEVVKEKLTKATEHHQRSILRYQGWQPWRKLMKYRLKQDNDARSFYIQNLLRKVLHAWSSSIKEERKLKESAADQMHSYLLVKKCFADWMKCKQVAEIDERKAVRFYERHRKLWVLRLWMDFVADQKNTARKNELLAVQHNILRIQRTAFHAWKRFPVFTRDAEKLKKRLEEMRKAVVSIIPDFSGVVSVVNDSDTD